MIFNFQDSMGRENEQQHDEWVVGRDDLNLAEFPLSVIGKRSPGDLKTLHFEDEVWDRSLEKYVPRKLTITGSDLLGLPNSLDDEVLLGCIQLTKEAGFTDRKVRFTRYELMDLIGWPCDGRSYERISESLDRWTGTLIISDKAFWDKQNQCWVKDSFNILDRVILSDREDTKNTKRKRSAIIWGDFMWQSFQAGNLKSLDYRFWQSLESPISKRLYRLLDKRFYKRRAITFDLHRLAFDKVGLSRNMHTGQIKEKLKPAHEELKDKGVCDAKYVKRARGEWNVVYDDVRHSRSELNEAVANDDKQQHLLEQLLIQRGITNAKELVSKYDEKRIKEAIENFDDRKAHGEDIGAGWLGKAIVHPEGFSFRKGFERRSPVKPKKAKKGQATLDHSEDQKQAEAEANQEAAKRIRRAQFLSRIAKLSEKEREVLETEAIRQAHAAGNRFIADHVQKLRREGESLETTGAIRQQFWWEYILTDEETHETLKAV
ncbi:replication initiator protein A [Pirellulaceae bacterium SH449]